MRIVGGLHKGKKLFNPKSDITRPTSDRVREALFNRLLHGIEDFELKDSNVLDLYAGTGALGLEALSRGAKYTLFIEEAVEPRGLIRQNIELLELTGQTKLFRRDATNLGPMKRYQPFNLVFIDPPYNQGLAEKSMLSAIKGKWLKDNALIIVEEAKQAIITWPDAINLIDTRTFGDTTIHFARYEP